MYRNTSFIHVLYKSTPYKSLILSFFRTRCLLPIHATKLISSLKTSEGSAPVIPWLHGIKSMTLWTSNDADAILNYGDSLYSRIFRNSSNELSLVTSFPQVCDIFELRVQVLPGESYTGLVVSNAKNVLALTNYSSPLALQHYALSASFCLLSVQYEITPFELKNLDPKNFHFAEKEFEEAESFDSDDLTLATIKTLRAKKAK